MKPIELKDPRIAQELQEVVNRVISRFHPDRIILYGSFAYGTPREDSDFDLLVILPDPPRGRDDWAAANEMEIKRMLQLVFMKPAVFEEEKDVVGGLAFPAHHWGKILYVSATASAANQPMAPTTRTRDQVIWDLVQGRIKMAESRSRMTEISLMEKLNDYTYAGFYSHAAAENYLKAFLVWRQVPWRKTHEIQKILDLFPVEDASLATELSMASWLTPYGEDFPDPTSPPVSPTLGLKAIEEAKQVRDLVMRRLVDHLSKGRPGQRS